MTCDDINECDLTGKDRVCDNATCQNSDEFHFRRYRRYRTVYRFDKSSLHFLPSKMKPALAGSYRCTCNTGYIHQYTNEVTSHCIDLNECKDSGSTNLTKYGPDGQTD